MFHKLVVFAVCSTLLPVSAFSKTSNVQVTVNIQNNGQGHVTSAAVPKTKKVAARKKFLNKIPGQKVAAISPVPVVNSKKRKPVQTATKPLATTARPTPVVIERLNQTAPVTPMSPTTTTTKLPLAQLEKAEKKPKWQFRYRSYNAMKSDTVYGTNAKPDQEVAAWDRFDVKYNITENVSIAVMPQFYHTWFGSRDRAQNPKISGLDQSYSGFMGNTAIILNDSKISKLSGDIVMDGFLRYDIPTSEIAQKSDSLGETWAELGLGKDWKHFGIRGSVQGRYYWQQYETSTLTNSETGEEIQNRQYRVITAIDPSIKFSEAVSFTLELGFMNEGKYGDSRPGSQKDPTRNDFIIFNPNLSFEISKNLALDTGYWEDGADMRSMSDAGYQPFNPANGGEYYIQGTVKF